MFTNVPELTTNTKLHNADGTSKQSMRPNITIYGHAMNTHNNAHRVDWHSPDTPQWALLNGITMAELYANIYIYHSIQK